MIRKNSLFLYGVQTQEGVFHSRSWNVSLPVNFLQLLLEELDNLKLSKIRFCIHPLPSDITQITYLAFKKPYEDAVHKHPRHNEIVIPLLGESLHRTFRDDGSLVKESLMTGGDPTPISTEIGKWHSIKILSGYFAMIEIGSGPFMPGSTIYK